MKVSTGGGGGREDASCDHSLSRRSLEVSSLASSAGE